MSLAASLFTVDTALTQVINNLAGQSPLLDLMMRAVSPYGVPVIVLAVVLQCWARARTGGTTASAVASGLSFLIGLGLNQVMLLFVSRIRTYDAGISHLIISCSADFSSPSDHATAAFAVAAAFLLHGLRKRGTLFLIAALLIAFSRVFGGIHYASDVVGGALTGIILAIGVRWSYRESTRLDRLLTSILQMYRTYGFLGFRTRNTQVATLMITPWPRSRYKD